MFNFIKSNETQPQKKLFTIQNYELVNHLVKDEAAFSGTTESNVIENLILSSYLNPISDELVYPIANVLYSKKGIATTCKTVFDRFALNPSIADDTLLALINYIEIIELRHKTIIEGNEPALRQLSKYASIFREQLKKYDGIFYSFITPGNTHAHIDMFDNMILDEISDIQNHIDDINIDGGFSTLISTIRKFWYFEGETETPGMRNWACTYRMLSAICDLANWPDYPQYRYELVQIIRNITLSNGQSGAYDSNQPVLSKKIFLKGGKSLITIEDAVILRSPSKREHTNAKIIIHGPNSGTTALPYIITFTEEEYDRLNEIAEQLVQEDAAARKEFPNYKDAYCVPIYCEGSYIDNRVKWKTI